MAAERGMKKIAVEVKTFRNLSPIADLEQAIGQYGLYEDVLHLLEPDQVLYLAVAESTFTEIFSERIGQIGLQNRTGLKPDRNGRIMNFAKRRQTELFASLVIRVQVVRQGHQRRQMQGSHSRLWTPTRLVLRHKTHERKGVGNRGREGLCEPLIQPRHPGWQGNNPNMLSSCFLAMICAISRQVSHCGPPASSRRLSSPS